MKYIKLLLAVLVCVAVTPVAQAQRLPVKRVKIKVYHLPSNKTLFPKGTVTGIKVKNPKFKTPVVQLPVTTLRLASRENNNCLNNKIGLKILSKTVLRF